MKLQKNFWPLLGLLLLLSLQGVAQEICDNGKDDDGDGLADLRDPDCQCHFNVQGNLLQNGSFESFDHCPTSYSFEADSKIIDGWQYGTYTNRSVAQYYHNSDCANDWSQVMLYIPPPLPLPSGKAFVSIRQYVYGSSAASDKNDAKVYIGQCLQTPLHAGTPYTLSFDAGRFQSYDDRTFKYKSEPFTVAVFGHRDCNAAPFGQPFAYSNGCPANYDGWVLLGNVRIHSKGKWVQSKISFEVPYDINVIEVGPDCSILNPSTDLTDSTTRLDHYVYYLDDLHLLPTTSFPFLYVHGASGDACRQDSILVAPAVSQAAYQWYKDSIALIGATQMTYHVPGVDGNGSYNVRITTNGVCRVSEPFIVQSNALASLRLPADTLLCFGDSLQLAPALNGVVYNWDGHQRTTVQIKKDGLYHIIAEANGCTRMFNVTVHALDCNNAAIYMPNAFTPNGDGKNDVFRIPQAIGFTVTEFSIFNRWGNKVFSTTNSHSGWDGTCKLKNCSVGTYAYVIKGTLNGKARTIKGTVVLIR